jgi:hypothetical protein
MPFDFVGSFIENAIVNSSFVSRDHMIDLLKKYPDNIYPRLTKLLKVETEILEIVFIKNRDGLRLLKFAPFELSTDENFLLNLIKKDVNTIGFFDDSMLKNIDFVKQVIFVNPESIHFLYDQFTSIYNTFKVEFDEIEADYLKALKLQDHLSISKTRPLINILNLHRKGLITPKLIEKIIPIEPDKYKEIEYSNNFQFNRNTFLQNSAVEVSSIFGNHNRLAEALIYLPESYKNDKEVVLKLIKELFTMTPLVDNPFELILANLSQALKNDEEVAFAFLEKSTEFITAFSDDIKNNNNVASFVLKNDGLMLKCFSKEIRSNHELVELAVQNNPHSYLYVDNEIRIDNANPNNKLLLYNALKGNPDLIMHIDAEWLKDEIVIEIIKTQRPILLGLLQNK